MAKIFNAKTISEVRYYFDLDINEVILILHQIMHELDVTRTEKFMNFTVEQAKEHYDKWELRKFTLTVLISNKVLSLPEIVGEIKKIPQPIRNNRR